MPAEAAPQNNDLKAKIDSLFEAVGSSSRILRLPPDSPEYAPFKGKRVLMVDDAKILIENFIPSLTVATDGNAAFILHTAEQSRDVLVDAILTKDPQIILMDYHLAGGVEGDDIIRAIIAKGFTGKIVGFSSDSAAQRAFSAAGAVGSVDKMGSSSDLDEPIKQAAQIAGRAG